MARIQNWSARVSNSYAFRRVGGRNKWLAQKNLEIKERRSKLVEVCVKYNYPFFNTIKFITARFIEEMQLTNKDYSVSHYTIVYDLQALFGENYVAYYKVLSEVNALDFPAEILDMVKQLKG